MGLSKSDNVNVGIKKLETTDDISFIFKKADDKNQLIKPLLKRQFRYMTDILTHLKCVNINFCHCDTIVT